MLATPTPELGIIPGNENIRSEDSSRADSLLIIVIPVALSVFLIGLVWVFQRMRHDNGQHPQANSAHVTGE